MGRWSEQPLLVQCYLQVIEIEIDFIQHSTLEIDFYKILVA